MTGDGTTSGEAGGPQQAGGLSAPTVQRASPPAEEYLHGVRAALADLPAPEVAEILDDVRAHLADLTAELGGEADAAALVARLGTPQAYAAELRAAAGYPSAPEQAGRPRSGAARLALAGLVASTLLLLLGIAAGDPGIILVAILIGMVGLAVVWREGPRIPGVAALPEVRRVLADRAAPPGTTARTIVDFLTSLQPAWWVARAFVAAGVAVGVLGGGGGAAAVIVVALLAVPVSIWLGYRTRRDRRWLWPVVPLNALAAALLLVLLGSGSSGVFGSPTPESSPVVYEPGLWQDGEREIRDIRPFDAAGNPLTGVYLFDQDGRAIDTSGGTECEGDYEGDYEGDSSTAGRNDPYPRGTREYDYRTDRCHLTPPGPLVVAVPASPTPGVPTTAPAAGPTAGPTTGPSIGPTAGPGVVPRTAPSGGPVPAPPAPPVAPPTG